MKKHISLLLAGLVVAVLFAACTPMEGSIDEVRRKAEGGGTRYTVSFESDGGTRVASQRVKEGELAAKPQDPSKSGWFFVNWFIDEDRETAYKFSTPVTANITLYADWVVTGTPRYDVTFNSKGGSYVEPQFVYQGKRAYPPDDPALRGYDFDAWCTTDGTPPTGVYNFSELITGNKTLYAAWDKVTTVPGANLAEKFAWLTNNALSGTEYTVQANASETLGPQNLSYPGYTSVTISLIGSLMPSRPCTVTLSGNGSLFAIGAGVTLVLENYITLKGHSSNNAALVSVNSGGELIMESNSTVTGNTSSGSGGGVYVTGVFTMNGGTISGNTGLRGGGVYVYSYFFAGNSVAGVFTMNDGSIQGNTARQNGGGVYVLLATGSVYGVFTKTGGTIYGYTGEGDTYGNVVKDSSGTVLDNRGHVAFVVSNQLGLTERRRETTAGSGVDLDSTKSATAGGWEN